MNQRITVILENVALTMNTAFTGTFKGFAELDREARERGFGLYPLTRPGTCTVLYWESQWFAKECGEPAIVNRARQHTEGWQMDDICIKHLKQELNR